VQLERVVTNPHSMPGIIAATETGNNIGLCCQPIRDTTLSFVAPLRSN